MVQSEVLKWFIILFRGERVSDGNCYFEHQILLVTYTVINLIIHRGEKYESLSPNHSVGGTNRPSPDLVVKVLFLN